MKKLILFFAILVMGLTAFGQKPLIFRPIPKDIFLKEGSRAIQGIWLWRLQAQVTAVELRWDKATHQFLSSPLSSVGPAIGYKHFVALQDGTPYNDFGVSGAFLIGTDPTQVNPADMKAALIFNGFNFVSAGVCYTFNNVNHFGILIGATINF